MSLAIKSYTGIWQIPRKDTKPQIWSGMLSIYEDNRIELEFVSKDEDIKICAPEIFAQLKSINTQKPIPLIVGQAKCNESGKDMSFSLIDSLLSGYQRSGLTSIKLEAKYCFDKYQVRDPAQLKFRLLMLKLEGFDEWMDMNGFNVKPEHEETAFQVSVSYKQPDRIVLIKNESFECYFYFRAKAPGFFVSGNRAEIEQSLFLNVEFSSTQTPQEIVMFSERIQNYFTLLFFYPARRLESSLRYSKEVPDFEVNLGNQDIDFFYDESLVVFSNKSKRINFPITYSQIENKMPTYFKTWLDLYDVYDHALEQYFDTIYFNRGHLVSRFVSFLSVLEIFCERKYPEKFKYLKDKLKELKKMIGEPISDKINFDAHRIHVIIDIRKFYVHGNKTILNDSKLSPLYLIEQNVRTLDNVFRILLFKEIGFEDAEIVKMIESRPWLWGLNK